MTKRESYASPGTAMRRNGAGDVRWRRVQAACEMRGNSTTLSRAGFCSARACSSISAAVSTQLPQQAPQPVRMVSSARPPQPAFAAWRMSLSVTPLQMHTYMVRKTPSLRERRHCEDRKSVVEGKGVSVRVYLGGRRLIKKKTI